jgi:hypothetical protein
VSRKDVRQLLARLRRQGFTWRVGGSGHYRVKAPGGDTVTVASTPSRGGRALANTRAALRRIGARL